MLTYKTLSGFNFENQPFGALVARSRPRKELGVACPRPGGELSRGRGIAGSSMGSWQAAPGNVSARCFADPVYAGTGIQQPIELPHVETFPGAACSAHFSAGTVM